MSALLESPLFLSFFVLVTSIFTTITFLKLEPNLKIEHKDTHFALSFASVNVAVGIGAANLALAGWHIPTSAYNIIEQIVLARINGAEFGSHAIPYFLVTLLVLVVFLHEKDGLKGMFYAGSIMLSGEVIWSIFYIGKYWSLINWENMGTTIFMAGTMAICVTYLFITKYHPNKWFYIAQLIMFTWDFIVVFYGNVSIFNNLVTFAPNKFGVSPYYNDFITNLTEVGGMLFEVVLFSCVELFTVQSKTLSMHYGDSYIPFKGKVR